LMRTLSPREMAIAAQRKGGCQKECTRAGRVFSLAVTKRGTIDLP
jgi:hypothetical protein